VHDIAVTLLAAMATTCFHVAYYMQTINMTSSIKLEEHNILQCHYRRTKPRPGVTLIKKISSGDMLADRQVHRETNTLITIFHSPNKKSKYVNTHTHNDTVQPSDLCGIVK